MTSPYRRELARLERLDGSCTTLECLPVCPTHGEQMILQAPGTAERNIADVVPLPTVREQRTVSVKRTALLPCGTDGITTTLTYRRDGGKEKHHV